MEAVLLLDATGRPVNARLLVAAEWVGISSRVDSGDAIIRFVPGGLAHALDPSLNRVLCGTDPDQLEAFAIDFTNDEWSFRCPECRRLAEAEERGQ